MSCRLLTERGALSLPQRPHLRQYALYNEPRGNRQPVVMQQRAQFGLLDRAFQGQQGLHLRVAILLHHEQNPVGGEELLHTGFCSWWSRIRWAARNCSTSSPNGKPRTRM